MYIPTPNCIFYQIIIKHEHDQSIYAPVRPQINQYNGVNKFLQRQVAARDEKQRKVQAMEYRGLEDKPRGHKITIPREPHFAKKLDHHGGQYNSNQDISQKKPSKLEVNFYMLNLIGIL